jgi:NAD(P)-dependent dehydrogenase (short-subunit alcohol dehydrogenase family)
VHRIVIAGRTPGQAQEARRSRSGRGRHLPHLPGRPGRHGGLRSLHRPGDRRPRPVDILINNAGRSIRRAIEYSYDRFHDFERTMQINYYSPLRLSLRVLPA